MKKIFILTGEPSGDKLASTVISKLKQKNSGIEYLCVGGTHLKSLGVESVAIMSNDQKNYPEDSFDNMINFSNKHKFGFPYLVDSSQEVAKAYKAVCTPDFFGFNNNLELHYRGRIRELKNLKPVRDGESDLLNAMKLIAKTGKGPKNQIPSMGCNIKWFK